MDRRMPEILLNHEMTRTLIRGTIGFLPVTSWLAVISLDDATNITKLVSGIMAIIVAMLSAISLILNIQRSRRLMKREAIEIPELPEED